MHVKLDEDLPQSVATVLREKGYSCSTVLEQGKGGWKDPALWEAVQDHQQFFVTADKGFGNIRRYPPGTHSGILLLRPSEDGIQPLLDLMEQVLALVPKLQTLQGLLAVASPKGLRVRRRSG
jgi:predicted nuclease of predicted toxin-antitoxin system